MERIPIPDQQVVALDHVAENVFGLRIAMVNVFAITSADGAWVLIDAGLPYSAAYIKNWAHKQFGEQACPRCIALTHGHFDHAGAAGELANDWDVPVYAHALELPFITGQAQYPAPDPGVGGGLMALLSPFYPRRPTSIGSRATALPQDSSIPGLQNWRWIHTPGHTEGHVSFFRDRDRSLVVGDAFCTTKAESLAAIATMRPELHGPPAYYTSDWAAAKRSVEKLAALEPHVVAPGHGRPIVGADVPTRLQQLAVDFDRVAVPEKYGATRRGAAGAF